MARFYPLFVRRSDGKREILAKGKKPETNAPTTEQLDQKPDKNGVSDYYREIAVDEAKNIDWRRKLGGMLAREMSWKDKAGNDNGYILADFPEGYRLYEHVKRTETDGQTTVKSKNHAAGGNDRQDAYLYGHPIGRRKRFRSPVDFFPHLLWLATNESNDQDNCGCRYCCPDDLENSIPGAKTKIEKPVKQEVEVKSELKAVTPTVTAATLQRPPSVQSVKPKQESITPAPQSAVPAQPAAPPLQSAPPQKLAASPHPGTPSQPAPPRQMMPSPLPQPQSIDQDIDRRYRAFMYRPGETVWFQKGQAWGLGAVLRRYIAPGNQYHYIVQPLSHPFGHSPPVVKSNDREMRPWLAWSVPRFTNDGLNNLAEPAKYDTMDWQGLMQKRYGSGDMEVDGSILAAKAIDATYTPLSPVGTREAEAGVTETYYNGIFIGAEKIWTGDPVRLQIGSGMDIMVINAIIERKRTAPMSNQVLESSVYFAGDVYTLATTTHTNPNIPTPASPQNNPNLPSRLTEDLAFRNAQTIPTKGIASYWNLVAASQRVSINDIKGRWYEASILLPVLLNNFDDLARQGDLKEASTWMNAHGDAVNNNRPPNAPPLPKVNIRAETRRDALGRSVPANAELRDGLEPPGAENGAQRPGGGADNMQIDPRFETAESSNAGRQQSVARHDYNNMNLDGAGGGQPQQQQQQMPPGYGRPPYGGGQQQPPGGFY